VTPVARSADAATPLDAALTVRFLAEAAGDLSSSLVLSDVFRRIAERVGTVLDCHLFCVMLFDEARGMLEHSYSLCRGEHVPLEGGFALGEGLSGHAALERRTIRIADVRTDPRYRRARHVHVDVRSELAVPLIVRDRLIGVLDIESEQLDAFQPHHQAVLETLAAHMAIALDNARLHGAVLENERRHERELSTAREVQIGLLPCEPPLVTGIELGMAYVPARELGGDFLDFLPYGGGRLALAVGDAAGKAAPAALLGAMAVGMLRGYGFQHRCGPAEMLRYLNERLRLPRMAPRFLAMLFAVYDQLDRSLTVSNGGMPWPYLVRGGIAEKIAVAGLPLGILDGFDYDEIRVALQPGDVVAFCSDGLTECTDARMDMFGDARMRVTLAAHAPRSAPAIAAALVDACAAHAGSREAIPDDCAVIVLKAAGG
jgi:sigma-B regulation protein RsbU (phosphoserine phosphatase)